MFRFFVPNWNTVRNRNLVSETFIDATWKQRETRKEEEWRSAQQDRLPSLIPINAILPNRSVVSEETSPRDFLELSFLPVDSGMSRVQAVFITLHTYEMPVKPQRIFYRFQHRFPHKWQRNWLSYTKIFQLIVKKYHQRLNGMIPSYSGSLPSFSDSGRFWAKRKKERYHPDFTR